MKNGFPLFLATFLIIGFFFLALPEKGYSGLPYGCCSTPLNGTPSCIGCESGCATTQGFCNENDGMVFTGSSRICVIEGEEPCPITSPQTQDVA